MMHAGVIKKFGLFMLIKVALPLLPQGAQTWLPILALLCLGNILYCGLVAMRQKDLNLLIGNSSVAHMGFVFLGIASVTTVGLTGAVMVMVAHGLLAGLAFGLSGYLYSQARTLDLDKITGPAREHAVLGHLDDHGAHGRLRLARLCKFCWRTHGVLWRLEGVPGDYQHRHLERTGDRGRVHAARHRTLLHGMKGEQTRKWKISNTGSACRMHYWWPCCCSSVFIRN